MKKKIFVILLICITVMLPAFNVTEVFAFSPLEKISFNYNGRVWEYEASSFQKNSSQFDIEYILNKYNRFGSQDERVALIKHLDSLGFDRVIAVEYLFPGLKKKIDTIEKNIIVKVKDAILNIDSNANQVFTIKNEVIGICLDREKLYDNIFNNFVTNKQLTFKLPVKKITPEITKRDYEKFINLRSDFSTDISQSSEDRKHNIKNSMNAMDKYVLLPNEVFSFNKVIGKRTEENGYRTAKIIINNEFVDGIGGGVCQVSSTLYNTALLAGLEIIEANKHSKQVSYVRYGFDAMVNFGSSDLVFRNNTREKVTIIANYSATKIRIRIFGEDLGNVKYKLINEIVKIDKPLTEEVMSDDNQEYLDKVVYNDEFFYLKYAQDGMEVKSYREKQIDNIAVEKKLLRYDRFKPQSAVKVYGTKKRYIIDPLKVLFQSII